MVTTSNRYFALYKFDKSGPESSPRKLVGKEEINHVISLAEKVNMKFCFRVVSPEEAKKIKSKLKGGEKIK